ncbi:hypothetical protein AFLA_014289 [Aspergillus flavus NRRL3357]|nr:hypothetical protein AFLA_014289 [Aspergillus flavus NRRL3357]
MFAGSIPSKPAPCIQPLDGPALINPHRCLSVRDDSPPSISTESNSDKEHTNATTSLKQPRKTLGGGLPDGISANLDFDRTRRR